MPIDGVKANLGGAAEPWVTVVERQLRDANAAIAQLKQLVAQLSKGS